MSVIVKRGQTFRGWRSEVLRVLRMSVIIKEVNLPEAGAEEINIWALLLLRMFTDTWSIFRGWRPWLLRISVSKKGELLEAGGSAVVVKVVILLEAGGHSHWIMKISAILKRLDCRS